MSNAVVPRIEIDPADLGPAMAALTPQRRAFVRAKAQGLTNAEAARAAGYSENSLQWRGAQLAHANDIQVAIVEESKKLLRIFGPKAILTLVTIMEDKNAANRDRICAAKELMSRGDLAAITQANISVDVQLTSEQTQAKIAALCAELELGPEATGKLLLGQVPTEMQENAEGIFVAVDHAPSNARLRATRARRVKMSPEEIEADKQRIAEQKREHYKTTYAEAQGRDGTEGLLDLLGLDPIDPETSNDGVTDA